MAKEKKLRNVINDMNTNEALPKINETVTMEFVSCHDSYDLPSNSNEIQANIKTIDISDKHMKTLQTKITHEKKPLPALRFDRTDHWPGKDAPGERSGFRCKLECCGKQTKTFCQKCNVHLCLVTGRNCFKKYHILNNVE